MAEKRMFTQKIIDSDAFLEMPLSTQALYFHLNMRADDDGFVNSPKRIQRTVGASEDDLKLLILKRFVISFETGVIVIKHWRMHNTLKNDRYKPTQYQEELATLEVKSNKSYTEKLPEPVWNQSGTSLEPQYSIGKNSIVEISVEESVGAPAEAPPTPEFGPVLQEAFEDWLKYKRERREAYKPTGLKSLTTQIKNQAAIHGEENVAALIRQCMASNWKGIIFDRLQGKTQSYGRSSTGFETSNPFAEMLAEERGRR